MTDYRVTFMKDLVAIDAYVRMEDEERQAYEENSGGLFADYEAAIVNRAAEIIEGTMMGDLGLVLGDLFVPNNWFWEVEEL